MYFIFDNLTASIVGGIVLMMLFGIQSRIQSNTVESTIMYAAKNQTLQFAELLERDLSNAGYLSTPGDQSILRHATRNSGGTVTTDTLEFWGSDGNGLRTRVRYVLDKTSSATIDGETVQLYQVNRYENNIIGWKNAGASLPTLTEFRIDLLDSANNGVVDIADARKMRVRFEAAVVGGRLKDTGGNTESTFLRTLRWGVTLSPKGLALQSFQG